MCTMGREIQPERSYGGETGCSGPAANRPKPLDQIRRQDGARNRHRPERPPGAQKIPQSQTAAITTIPTTWQGHGGPHSRLPFEALRAWPKRWSAR